MPASTYEVAEYYDTHQFYYSHFWSHTALHYGFWYDDTKNLADAIANTNRFISDILAIDSHDVVLDAGCGVGGTSLYIAETTGARLEGITLSSVQLKIAKKRAAQSCAASLLRFTRQNYACTEFKDSTFSKLFAIESVCHATKKSDFLAEAYRIMKQGGRLAIVDVFLTKETLDAEEQSIYRKVIEGWAIPNLTAQAQFCSLLAQAGFTRIVFYDMQRYVETSIRKIYQYGLMTFPINFLKSKLGVKRGNFACLCQKALFDKKIALYGVFIAEKANRATGPEIIDDRVRAEKQN